MKTQIKPLKGRKTLKWQWQLVSAAGHTLAGAEAATRAQARIAAGRCKARHFTLAPVMSQEERNALLDARLAEALEAIARAYPSGNQAA